MKKVIFFLIFNAIVLSGKTQNTPPVNQYKKADSIAALYPEHSLHNLPDLANKLTHSLATEEEKIRAIYTWVSTNISNDYDTYLRNRAKRKKFKDQLEKLLEWNKKANKILFKNLLSEHKSICSGYSYLISELAFHAGLKCDIINGYGKNNNKESLLKGMPNHSWNAINLEGKWFFIDATWSSGIYKVNERKFDRQFSDTYFLTPPDLFILNHYPANPKDTHISNPLNIDTFLDRPIVSSGGIQFKVVPISPQKFRIKTIKGDSLQIILSNQQTGVIEQIALKINKKVVKAIIKQDGNNRIIIDYTFNKKGLFSTEVFINKQKAVSYSVTVEK